MKSIKTLVKDIQDRILSREKFDEGDVKQFGSNLAEKLANRLSEAVKAPSLRLSNLGTPCDRKLWYSTHVPEVAEPLSPSARLKFLFGDILEELVLFLAKSAGHEVTRQQEEVNVNGVRGHIDACIDNELVDVKSASSYSFNKFAAGLTRDGDGFGYIDQLGAYRYATGKPRAHFLVVDKTLGKICLDTHEENGVNYDRLVEQKRKMLASTSPPPRGYDDEAERVWRTRGGQKFLEETGNRTLGIQCSYCPFKKQCWPGLRLFKYARKPVFMTKVVKTPQVEELPLETPEE